MIQPVRGFRGADPPSGLQGRAVGAYLGLAVGDALGATVEFMLPNVHFAGRLACTIH